MQSYDIIIAGGGMVGLAVACGLKESGLSVAVLEQGAAPHFSPQDPLSVRVSAINRASQRLLEKLGVWQDILQMRASCYHGMKVWEKDSFGQIAFDDGELGGHGLGYIIENSVLHAALWRQAEKLSHITLIPNAALVQTAFGDNETFVSLQDGSMMTARLMVAADGAQSWLRAKADIPLTFWDYKHHALVANIRTEQPHQGVARQVFHGEGILAFLPFEDPHHCSIVWSTEPQTAKKLSLMDESLFCQQLAVTFDMQLGPCTLNSERKTFPLTARYARQFASHRLVLVGDAAHTIHPLAGQGVNLGFMDAAELIGQLLRLQQEGKDIGQHLYLRRYERLRKLSAAKMLASMQSFQDLFAGQHPLKKMVRDIGLTLADKLPGIKPQLIKQALGEHDLPEWLRK